MMCVDVRCGNRLLIDDQLKGASCSSAIEAASSEGCVGRSSLVNDQVFDSVWKEGRKSLLMSRRRLSKLRHSCPHNHAGWLRFIRTGQVWFFIGNHYSFRGVKTNLSTASHISAAAF